MAGKKIKEPSIAAVAKSNVNDLRRRAIQQCPLVEIDILANDSKIFYLAKLPNCTVSQSKGCAQIGAQLDDGVTSAKDTTVEAG